MDQAKHVVAGAQTHGVGRHEQVVMQGDAGMGCSSDLRTSAGGNASLLGRQLLSLLGQAHHLACIPLTHAMHPGCRLGRLPG